MIVGGNKPTGSQALHVVEVMRRAGSDDRCAGQLRILDREASRRGAGAIDQHGGTFDRRLPWEGQFERLIERLADTGEGASELAIDPLNSKIQRQRKPTL